MASGKSYPAGLIPAGFQVMTLSNSTAVAVNSTVRAAATELHISVETNNVRYRHDGTDPTKTTGVLVEVGALVIDGFNGTAALKFQRSTGTSKVSIAGWRHAGLNTRP